ncbi:MAG: NTP transferase domain-containing protein [candidate division Zixibacteria bacterium]|nr:NTP transferase domain-containing protein [candidate division Zixibacteria bacterium]
MKAVIMAGGFGTRLRPLSLNIPKPMVFMAGKPMMEHIVRLLAKYDFNELIALLYFQSDFVKDYFKTGARFGVKFKYKMAAADYGTAGSVKNADEYLDERFIVISGDVLTDFDLKACIDFHISKKAKATMVLTRVENPLQYGVVITDKKGRITRFLEKPTWGQVFSDTVNTGIYILEPEVLNLIPEKTEFDFSKDLFPGMLERGEDLYGYVAPGYWRDVGNLDEYAYAHQDILEGKVKVDIGGNVLTKNDSKVWADKNVHIGEDIEFDGTVIIGENTVIGDGCKLSNSVIGAKCEINKGASISRSVIWDEVGVGMRAHMNEAIVCNNAKIGADVGLNEKAIVSENCVIGEGAVVKANVKVWPDKKLEAGAILTSSLVWGETWNRELFYDAKVSGIGNTELTPEFAAKLGAAYGAFLGKHNNVLCCRDAGLSSRMINRAINCGLLSAGINILDLQMMPIPVLRFEQRSGKSVGGFHVRRSPFDEKVIDIIFFDGDGMDIPESKSKTIERMFFREDFRRAQVNETGRIDYPQRVVENYRRVFLRAIDTEVIKSMKFKIVLDYSFGGACDILPSILGALGIETVSLNAYQDPQRQFQTPDQIQERISQLSSIVKSLKAHIGFMINPGAEKIDVIDERGRWIPPDKLLLLVTSLYLQLNNIKSIAVPVAASMGVEKIAGEYGVKVVRTRNDHLSMMEAFHRKGVDFVGGTRGGFIFPGFQLGADAMFALVKILELLATSKTPLGRIRGEWEKYTMIRESVACGWAKKGQVMRNLIEYTEKANRQLIDGIRVLDNDSSLLVWPDRKQAYFHLTAESRNRKKADQIVKEYQSKIKEWQN